MSLDRFQSAYGRSKFVVVADEFNYLHSREQENFLRDFFEVLISKKIFFALVGVGINPDMMPGFRQCVETNIALVPFSSWDSTKELITSAISQSSDFQFFDVNSMLEEQYERIHLAGGGNPRYIQEICYMLFHQVHEQKCASISSEMLEQVVSAWESEIEQEKRILRGI